MKTKIAKTILPLLFLFSLVIFSTGEAKGQTPPPPDCVVFFSHTFTSSTVFTSGTLDNRSLACTTWTVWYQATATSGTLTGVTFQSALGATTAGTFGTYTGTVLMGSANPLTGATGQVAYFANETVSTPWLRVSVNPGTFRGALNGVFYGYRTGYQGDATSGGGGGGGGGCTSMSECIVIGPDAVGATPTANPVQVSGFDGTDVRRVLTDSGGRTVAVGAAASGGALTGNPVLIAGSDGTDARSMAMNVQGQPKVVGGTVDGGLVVPGNLYPVLTGVYDGVDARYLRSPSALGDASDGNSAAAVGGMLYNGATYDRSSGNTLGTYIHGATASGNTVSGSQHPVLGGVVSSGGKARYWFTPDALNNTGDTGVQSGTVAKINFNGSTYDKEFVCNSQANISVSAGTDVTIVTAGGAGTFVKICHVSFSQDNPAVVTFRQGTGTTCGTNQLDISGGYQNVLGLALDFTPSAALTTTIAARDICLHFSTSVTAGGIVKYTTY